jgi:hypothetical protein
MAMIERTVICAVLCAIGLAADSIVLRSGKTVEGTYLGGDARRVRIAVDDEVQTIAIDEISQIRFGSQNAAATTKPKPGAPKQRAELMRPDTLTPRPAQASAASSQRTELPAGTSLVVRLIDDVDSERDAVGQTFRASIDEAVVLDGRTVIPRGADVVAKLVADRQAGRLTGRTELTLDLQSVTVNGRKVEVTTQEVTQQSESRTRETATRTGGAAALGAVIGAIAGGGKGAAIGAVTGAAAGGAVQVLTKGPKVRIPSETRLTFNLQNPLSL